MPTTLRPGSLGFEVALLQLQLNLKGLPSPHLQVDGAFGSRTHAAVVAFQRRAGLGPDGVVGPLTHAALAQGLALSAVHHPLTHIAQPTPTTCWAAATAMITGTTVATVRARTPADMVAADGGLLNSSESDQAVVSGARYGAMHRLRCHAPMSWSVSGLLGRLQAGPLMFDMLWNTADYLQGQGSPGHMVVISAAVSDNNPVGAGTHLLMLDPWPPRQGKVRWIEYGRWMQTVPAATYRIFEGL